MSGKEETGRLIRLELKYCERCGGLLVRGSGEKVVYCRSCAEALEKERMEEMRLQKELPGGRQRGRRSATTTEVAGATDQFPPKKPVQSARIEASEQRRQG